MSANEAELIYPFLRDWKVLNDLPMSSIFCLLWQTNPFPDVSPQSVFVHLATDPIRLALTQVAVGFGCLKIQTMKTELNFSSSYHVILEILSYFLKSWLTVKSRAFKQIFLTNIVISI